jgi:uncharacterized protein (TIGR02145 family)
MNLAFQSIILIGCDKDILTLPVGKGNYINITTSEINSITANSAKCNFIVSDLNSETVTEQGICWDITKSPTTSSKKVSVPLGTGSFTAVLTNLVPNQTYYLRPYIKTKIGLIMYGDEKYFITKNLSLAILGNLNVPTITANGAKIEGNILNDGASSLKELGIIYSDKPNPTISENIILLDPKSSEFSFSLSGLNENSTFYLRPYAINSVGLSYGNTIQIKTLSFNEKGNMSYINDLEGNVYKTVNIDQKIWMGDNLNTSKFSNGDIINNVKDRTSWTNLKTPAWCNYGNDDNLGIKLGKLYNWFSVNDSRNICPSNWHVASDDEWTSLINLLGGDNIAGGPLKETGFTTWSSPNKGATNSSGLNIKSNGYRNFEITQYTDQNLFSALGSYGTFWTSSSFDQTNSWHRYFYWGETAVNRGTSNKINGLAIRCIKNR